MDGWPSGRHHSLDLRRRQRWAQAARMDEPGGTQVSESSAQSTRAHSFDPASQPGQRSATAEKKPIIEPKARPSESGSTHISLKRHDQLLLAFLSFILLGLMSVHWLRLSNWGRTPVEIEHLTPRSFDFRLDVNTATWVEFGQLDGVGDTLARRIVADREQNGPFASVDDLRRVKGIGPKILEKLRPWLEAKSPSADSPASEPHAHRRSARPN